MGREEGKKGEGGKKQKKNSRVSEREDGRGREEKRREEKAARWGSPAGTNNGRQNAVGHPLPSFLKRREIGPGTGDRSGRAKGARRVGWGRLRSRFQFKWAEVTRSRQMWADVSPAVRVKLTLQPLGFSRLFHRFFRHPFELFEASKENYFSSFIKQRYATNTRQTS